MARKAMVEKSKRKPKFGVRQHNRCGRCGRSRAFLRKFGVCRICFRELALSGFIPGVLKENNFIQDYKTLEAETGRKTLRVVLKYAQGGQPVIRDLKRVSTPGLRKYVGVTEIPRVRNGLGMAILSTSQGLMTDRQARQARTGGELLALVW